MLAITKNGKELKGESATETLDGMVHKHVNPMIPLLQDSVAEDGYVTQSFYVERDGGDINTGSSLDECDDLLVYISLDRGQGTEWVRDDIKEGHPKEKYDGALFVLLGDNAKVFQYDAQKDQFRDLGTVSYDREKGLQSLNALQGLDLAKIEKAVYLCELWAKPQ